MRRSRRDTLAFSLHWQLPVNVSRYLKCKEQGETMITRDWGTSSLAASAFALSALLLSMCIAMATIAGCERTEPVIHVDTPGGEVEVDRNLDTGEVTVDVDDKN